MSVHRSNNHTSSDSIQKYEHRDRSPQVETAHNSSAAQKPARAKACASKPTPAAPPASKAERTPERAHKPQAERTPERARELVTIERMSYGPWGIAHGLDHKTLFVLGGVTGDVCEVVREKETKHSTFAQMTSLKTPSPKRITPAHSYQEHAGGAPWASLSYQQQLIEKRDGVVQALIRVGHISQKEANELVQPCIPSKKEWGYRNKIELGCAREHGKLTIGMYDPLEKKLVPVNSCALMDARFAKLTKSVAGALQFIARSQDLGLERIGIRASVRTKEVELALWTRPGAFPRAYVSKILNSAAPELTSIVRVLSKGSLRARKVVGTERLWGKGSWTESIGDETMTLSAPSFFQVNTRGAETLIKLVREGLRCDQHTCALDLYCGAGTFTLPLARVCKRVYGVEAQGSSIQDLRRHIKQKNLNNVMAIGGDANREFPQIKPDCAIVDPPRAGLEEAVVRKLRASSITRLCYVSCDPQTLARDLARLTSVDADGDADGDVAAGARTAAGTAASADAAASTLAGDGDRAFTIERITPVDLFPQSFHVENVCVLTRAD